MADRAEPHSPTSQAGEITGGRESGGASQDVFDTQDMGIEADDGLSAELSALVAKVAGGFNAPESSRPAPQAPAQSDAPLGLPSGAQDMGPAGGGVQPAATPLSPDPGPPYDDEISTNLEIAEDAPAPPADGGDEEASEWVFVEIEGGEDTAETDFVEPPGPAASDDGFRAHPTESEVDFVEIASAPELPASEQMAEFSAETSAGASPNGPTEFPDGGPTLASLTNESPRPSVEMRSEVPEPRAAIPLDIAVEASEADSDDVLTIEIQGLPEGSTLSAGSEQLDGSWLLDAAVLADLTVSPPAGWITDFEIEITATETDPDTGESSSISDVMMVDVSGGMSAVAPEAAVMEAAMAPNPISGSEFAPDTEHDTELDLEPDPESEVNTSPVPEVRFGEHEEEPARESEAAAPVAPLAAPAEMLELVDKIDAGQPETSDSGVIAFCLDAALVDTDGSERLTLLVTGLPEGAGLTGGKRGPKGTWLLTPNDIDELGIELLPDMTDDLTVRVQVIATERGDPRVSTVLTDMMVWVENCGSYWRTTSVNARTDDGNVAFAPGEPGRITVLSEVSGWMGSDEDGEAAGFLSLPPGYRIPWISPGVDADDRWTPGPEGTGGVLDLTDFITADGRLNWTFGVEAGMRADPAASADFRVTTDRPPISGENIMPITGDDGLDAAAGNQSLRGGGGEDRQTNGTEETPPVGAGSPARGFPAPGNGHDGDEHAVTAELELSKGTVVDSDAGSVTLSADAVGTIRLRDGVLKIKGVRAIEW